MVLREIGKKKRALAVLTEKAMANKTKEGMSLHDEYIRPAETCQVLQKLNNKKKTSACGHSGSLSQIIEHD